MIHLYVKTHRNTGLMYFGKTVRDPFKYTGSGKYWLKHLKAHGNNVHTDVLLSTENEEFCKEFAILFSKVHNVVHSDLWANLRLENGLDGAPVGHAGSKLTAEGRARISESSRQRWADDAQATKIRNAQVESWTEERKEKQRATTKAAWSEERRRKHSERLKQLRQERDDWGSCKGKPKSPEHRQKISNALKGNPRRNET